MKDYLNDLVSHTHVLGNITFLKITGSEDSSSIEAVSDDKSVIVQGKFKNPVPEFIGVFGMPNLSKLNVILNIPEYQENAVITLNTQEKNGEQVPCGLHFENKSGDFKNDYRFMSTEVVNEKLKAIKFKGVKWNVTINPEAANIQRFKFQQQASNEEPLFLAKTENKTLKFFFGDINSTAGDFVFANNVTGTLSKGWQWPVKSVLDILTLVGDKTMMFSDEGALQITIDSGLAEYSYILPAMTK
jgi:hypothetical protein